MTWTNAQLLEHLAWCARLRGDTTTVEVKDGRAGVPTSIAASLCSFANMPNGGTIIVGVEEPTFTIVGVAHPALMASAIADQARTMIDPAPYVEFQTLWVEGKAVVLAHVAGLSVMDKPARLRGKAYLRMADGDYVMGPHELKIIESHKLHNIIEQRGELLDVPGTGVDDLDGELVAGVIKGLRAQFSRLGPLDDAQVLTRYHLLSDTGAATVAALYALGSVPQADLPDLHVSVAEQHPDGKARTRGLARINGPIGDLLEETVAWIARHINCDLRYTDTGAMTEVHEFPLPAIREAVANALVHRDLTPATLGVGRSVTVRLTRTALIITNPGGLRGVSVERLTSGETARVAVNPLLYELATLVRTPAGDRVIEGEGGGVAEILRAMAERGLRPPTFIDTGTQFSVIFWRDDDTPGRSDAGGHGGATGVHSVGWADGDGDVVQAGSTPAAARSVVEDYVDAALAGQLVGQLGANAAYVYSALVKHSELTMAQLVDITYLSKGQVRYALGKLLDSGKVRMIGKHGVRGTTYAPVGV